MDAFHLESVALVVIADLVIVEGVSVLLGLIVARANGSSAVKGLVVGLLIPILGPLGWGVLVLSRDPSRGVFRRSARGPVTYGIAGALGVAALLFLLGAVMPWGEAMGEYERYQLAGDFAATDTVAGLSISGVTLLLMLACAVTALVLGAAHRLAILTAVVGGVWFLITVDGLILLSALSEVSLAVEGVVGGLGSANVSARAGLWSTLAAAVLTLATSGFMGFVAPLDPDRSASWRAVLSPRRRDASQFGASSERHPQGEDFEYGDGF